MWAPDSQHFLFASSVYPQCESHAASVAERASEESGCNTLKELAAAGSKVQAQVFDHLLYRHWNAYTGAKRSHVFYAGLPGADGAAGAARDLTPQSVVGDAETPTFSLGGPLGYAIAPDGKEVAYVTNLEVGFAKPGVGLQPGESTNNDVFTLRLGEPGAKAKKVSTSPGSDDGPQYSPDGKWLAWRSQARNGFESDKFELVVMDRATSALMDLTESFDGWVDEFTWGPKSDTIYFASPLERGKRESSKQSPSERDSRRRLPGSLVTASLDRYVFPRMIRRCWSAACAWIRRLCCLRCLCICRRSNGKS